MEKTKSCQIFSKANHPITIQYDGKNIVVPPFARGFKLADATKVGKLPKNLRLIEGE